MILAGLSGVRKKSVMVKLLDYGDRLGRWLKLQRQTLRHVCWSDTIRLSVWHVIQRALNILSLIILW